MERDLGGIPQGKGRVDGGKAGHSTHCRGRANLRNSSCPCARAQDRAGRPGRAVSLGQSRGKDMHNHQAQALSWLSTSA